MSKKQYYLKLLTLAFLLSYCKGQLSTIMQTEAKLVANITNGYNKNIRPQATVEITSLVQLKQIISIDEKNQIMTSSVYISQLWYDPRLVWDPTIWGGIDTLMIPAKTLWLPDTFIINTADTDGYLKLNSDFSLITVYYDGSVYLILPVVSLKTRCTLYTRSFPFDKQTCNITYTSWSQGSNRLKFSDTQDSVDLSDYTESPIWTLLSTNVTTTRGSDRVPFEDANNTNINVVLNLQRKPLYFMMNGVFACLILNCITLLLYALPFPMQLGLSLTCFMTYSVYSLSFSNSTPTQSDFIPLITLYFVLSISFALTSMMWFVLCNHWTTKQTIPKWLDKFCGFLQRVFFCCFETKEPNIWLCCCKAKSVDGVEKGPSWACCPPVNGIKSEKVTSNNIVDSGDKINSKIDDKLKLPDIFSTGKNDAILSLDGNDKKEKNESEKTKEKCDFCNRCEDCQADFKKEKEKGKTKKDIESKMSALNYLIFIFAFIYCLTFQLSIWLSLSQ